MRVLVACEFSGTVRNAFLRRGHDAWSCDLVGACWYPSNGRHIKADVRPLLREPWDLVTAHPPCTYLCNSGVRWLVRPGRSQRMEEACRFFCLCLEANAKMLCVENPIQHKYARFKICAEYSQIIQPYQFGEPTTKATCLWLRDLPLLKPTKILHHATAKVHTESPGPRRKMLRSITPQGIAEAMADQWGSLDVK